MLNSINLPHLEQARPTIQMQAAQSGTDVVLAQASCFETNQYGSLPYTCGNTKTIHIDLSNSEAYTNYPEAPHTKIFTFPPAAYFPYHNNLIISDLRFIGITGHVATSQGDVQFRCNTNINLQQPGNYCIQVSQQGCQIQHSICMKN